MANIETIDLDTSEYPVKEMEMDIFLEYLAKHPLTYIRTLKSDVYNLGLNTGINTLTGKYLGLYEMPESTQYWKHVRDERGLTGSVLELFNWSPMLIIVNVLASIRWLVFLILTFYGVILFLKDKQITNIIKLTALIFPIYIIATQFIASTPRWSHRTPAEFVFCSMFALAIVHLGQQVREKRGKVEAK